MIKIQELRALRGPNRHSGDQVIFMVLDIMDYEEKPSNKIDGFTDRLVEHIPSLREHKCSIGEPGGFIERLKEGTWAGHIIEHIAIELQCLAGMKVAYGKTITTMQKGKYIVVFRYIVESVGMKVAETAVSIFETISKGENFDIKKIVSDLRILREDDMLGPTTWSIVKEAKSRNIPFIRLNENSYIQLGYGIHQKRIQASITSQSSAISVEAVDEKTSVKKQLSLMGIPVPKGEMVSTVDEAVKVFNDLGVVVVKPDVGNHGNGSTINISTQEQLKKAYYAALKFHPDVIVEEYISGEDIRLLVIDGKLVAAAKRDPAHVTGDGISTILELITKINKDPRRGFGHEKVLTKIEIDEMTERLLSLKGLTLDHIPEKEEKVYLKTTANISQGGTATDITDEISPEIRIMAERTARIIGLDCVGIDALAKDISLPLNQSGLKVVEVNAAPGFRMHLEPTYGVPRNVAKPLVDMLFPDKYTQVPVLAVTGTNGKTTTCKLISHTLKYSGKNVGLACTTGVGIDGNFVLKGDYSGPEGAGIILREPTIDHIVLEVARGGLVRRGLGVSEVDIGVLLNVGTDHLGTDWIETRDDLCLVKSTVIEAVKESGTSVLNADDEASMNILKRAHGKVILFSLNPENLFLIEHIKSSGTVVTVVERVVIIRSNELDVPVCTLEEIPITFGGAVEFNISNALAAIAALHGMELPLEQIRNGVMAFHPSVTQNPGRMNLLDFQNFKVLLDYCHNPESAKILAGILPKISKGRKVGLCHGTGNRTSEQLIEYGMVLAEVYDYIVLTDYDPRNRPSGETITLVKEGLLKNGFKEENIDIVIKSEEAVDYLFSIAEKGDLLIINPDDLETVMAQIIERYRQVIG